MLLQPPFPPRKQGVNGGSFRYVPIRKREENEIAESLRIQGSFPRVSFDKGKVFLIVTWKPFTLSFHSSQMQPSVTISLVMNGRTVHYRAVSLSRETDLVTYRNSSFLIRARLLDLLYFFNRYAGMVRSFWRMERNCSGISDSSIFCGTTIVPAACAVS